jgi:hypothetical protein
MKYLFSMVLLFGIGAVGKPQGKKQLFIDVHYLGAGKVSYEAVAQAHAKDLATEGKYRVEFLKYWETNLSLISLKRPKTGRFHFLYW